MTRFFAGILLGALLCSAPARADQFDTVRIVRALERIAHALERCK